jgi:hypothetical protein
MRCLNGPQQVNSGYAGGGEYGEHGFLAAGLVAILDPAMIVTGGSVGSNWLIVAAVRKTLAAISPHTVVAASQWGQQATVEGAVLALDAAQIRLLGRAVKTALAYFQRLSK